MKKLAAKASLIQMPPTNAPVPPPATAPAPAAESRGRTAPGAMAQFLASQSNQLAELDALRERVKVFAGAVPVRPIDPRAIRPSRWANRHPDAFATEEFESLKQEISAAAGNVQPIKVRPLEPVGEDGAEYEIVFGHRRHRACLELGLPVLALVEPLDDRHLFEAMERENRGRENLSAWEQGTMYQRALDQGLYPSQRALAAAIGVDVALVSRAVALARLPAAVVGAFGSPLNIQFRWAQPLGEALQRDPDGLVRRALDVSARDPRLKPVEVLEALVAAPGGSAASARTTDRSRSQSFGRRGKGATLRVGADGRTTVEFARGALTPAREEMLLKLLKELFDDG